jgi:hypothetical protein
MGEHGRNLGFRDKGEYARRLDELRDVFGFENRSQTLKKIITLCHSAFCFGNVTRFGEALQEHFRQTLLDGVQQLPARGGDEKPGLIRATGRSIADQAGAKSVSRPLRAAMVQVRFSWLSPFKRNYWAA